MEQGESLAPKEDSGSPPQIFSSTDLELISLLSQIDSALVDIVKGVRRALSDIENPDRFAQAANSIRHLTNILIRNAQDKIAVASGTDFTSEQSALIARLSENFNSLLSSIPGETDDKQGYVDYLDGKFADLSRELKLCLKGEPLTTKQVLKSYFGREEELSLLQDFVQKRIKEAIMRWHNCHKYFVKVSHYSNDKRIDEADFRAQWEEIQRCVLMVLRPFFSTASIIDEIMKLEKPPHE